MFTFSVLALLPFTSGAFSKVCSDYYKEMMELSVGSMVIGGALMGLGMTVSGSVVFYTAMLCFNNKAAFLWNLVPNLELASSCFLVMACRLLQVLSA